MATNFLKNGFHRLLVSTLVLKHHVHNQASSVAQIVKYGDPILQKKCELVSREQIKSPEIQNLIQSMVSVMRHHGLIGLAAPQIGASKQIIVMEFTQTHLSENWSPKNAKEVRLVPLTVLINPVLTVTDSKIVKHHEMCASVLQKVFVPRAYGVEVTGLDENGGDVRWAVTGWPARILQHEIDHLNGELNIEKQQYRNPLDLLKSLVKWLQNS